MPNAFVFPGGVVSKADFAQGWIDLFRECGHSKKAMDCLSMEGRPRPFLMEAEEGEAVPRRVAFRLAAIRETFEESGVLLLTQDTEGRIPVLTPELVEQWRPKVHKEPEQMLNLCRQLGTVPDIWSLSEWSDWLTPLGGEHGARRFDTIFYTAHLPSMPDTLLDQAETYELSRLLHFPAQKDLQDFAKKREKEGVETMLPVRVDCSDGTLSIYPGDSRYPSSPDYVGSPESVIPRDEVSKHLAVKACLLVKEISRYHDRMPPRCRQSSPDGVYRLLPRATHYTCDLPTHTWTCTSSTIHKHMIHT